MTSRTTEFEGLPARPVALARHPVALALRIAPLVALAFVLACGGANDAGEADGSVTTPDGMLAGDAVAPDAGAGRIGPEGGTAAGDGASVSIPAGALASPVVIEVGLAADVALPEGFEPQGESFRFAPHGQSFALPATITIPVSAAAGTQLEIFRRDDDDDTTWEQVGTAEVSAAGHVSLEVDGFSLYRGGRSLLDGGSCAGGQGVWDRHQSLCWENPPGQTTALDWYAAADYCTTKPANGPYTWRLPKISEYMTIVNPTLCDITECGVSSADPTCLDSSCYDAACAGCDVEPDCYWPGTLSGVCETYWSWNTMTDYTTQAWVLDWTRAWVTSTNKVSDTAMVRCVLVPL